MDVLVINTVLVLLSLFGLVDCFWGCRIFKVILQIFGFVIGAGAGAALGLGLSNGNFAVALFAGLLGGLLGAVIIVALRALGIFLIGAFLGLLAGSLLMMAGLRLNPVFLLVVAVIGGILCLVLDKLMIIVATAFGGAWFSVFGFASVFLGNFGALWGLLLGSRAVYGAGGFLSMLVLMWLALGVIGILVQYGIIPLQQYATDRLPLEELLKKWELPKASVETPESINHQFSVR